MTNFLRPLFIVAALFGCLPAYGVQVDSSRALVIDGVIARGNLAPLGDKLMEFAAESTRKPVDLIINSPGGEVVTGRWFINYMERARSLGVTIRCFVPEVAASMAFSIFLHCDERYALAESFHLWHRVRVYLQGEVITSPQALTLGEELAAADEDVMYDLRKSLKMTEEQIMYHFERETLHSARNLRYLSPGFLRVETAIDGLFEAMSDETVMRSKKPGMFDSFELIYIPRRPILNSNK